MKNKPNICVAVIFLLLLSSCCGVLFCESINSGYVIAYGKFIERPYNVELKDEKIYINGIQVIPTIEKPDPQEKEKKEFLNFSGECEEKYYEWKGKYSETKAKKMLGEYLSKHPKVKSYKFITGKTDDGTPWKAVVVKLNNGYENKVHYTSLPPSQYKVAWDLLHKYSNQYKEWFKQYGKEKARKMIKNAISKDPLIDKFDINDSHIRIFCKNSSESRAYYGLKTLERQVMAKPADYEWERQYRVKYFQWRRDSTISSLRKDGFIIFRPGGGIVTWAGKSVLKEINDIIASKKSVETKRKLLKEIDDGLLKTEDKVVDEIIENYKVVNLEAIK